ncbi:MAG: hypothetical protein HGB14_06415 [Anaerolineaceae bacterium]|nr:hypothetical protein [Anaerolineaceae bacterium]
MKDALVQNISVDESLSNWGRLNFVMTAPENKVESIVSDVHQRLSKSFNYFQSQRDRVYVENESLLSYKIHSWVIDPKKESLQKILNDLDHFTN